MKKTISRILLTIMFAVFLFNFAACMGENTEQETPQETKPLYEQLPTAQKNSVDAFIAWFLDGKGRVLYPETIRIELFLSAENGALTYVGFYDKDRYGTEHKHQYFLVAQESKMLQKAGEDWRMRWGDDDDLNRSMGQTYFDLAHKGTVILCADKETKKDPKLVYCPVIEQDKTGSTYINHVYNTMYDCIFSKETQDKADFSNKSVWAENETKIIQEYVRNHNLSSGVFD